MIRNLALLGALTLAACSGGNTASTSNILNAGAELRDTVRANRASRQQPAVQPAITRAGIEAATIPALEVTLEARDQTAILLPSAFRTDDGPGDVAVWQTVDDIHIVLREGVLIATRGLGRDVTSADVLAAVSTLKSRSSGGGAREMRIRNDDFGADTLRFSCVIEVVGDTAVEIVERRFPARHLREKCSNSAGTFVNDYWVDPARDVIQSRQWAGPHLGFIRTRVLKK
ncbi:MAG: YjbF family lipoprotein [Pseudomonadota bacterium]